MSPSWLPICSPLAFDEVLFVGSGPHVCATRKRKGRQATRGQSSRATAPPTSLSGPVHRPAQGLPQPASALTFWGLYFLKDTDCDICWRTEEARPW